MIESKLMIIYILYNPCSSLKECVV